MADTTQTNPTVLSGLNATSSQDSVEDSVDRQYTIFASGLNWGGRSSLLAQTDFKRNVGIVFDVVSDTSFVKTYQKSQYALESKAQASDHVQEQDGKFSFTGRVSDVPTYINDKNFIDRDTDKDKPMESKRATRAFEILHDCAKRRSLVGLVTEDNILTNYVITSITNSRNGGDGSSLLFQIEMEEFRLIDIGRTVLATTDAKKGGKKNGGAKQTAAGGSVSNDAEGKRNPSPYISKGAKGFESVDKAITGNTYDQPADSTGGTIRPDGKFNSNSLLR